MATPGTQAAVRLGWHGVCFGISACEFECFAFGIARPSRAMPTSFKRWCLGLDNLVYRETNAGSAGIGTYHRRRSETLHNGC